MGQRASVKNKQNDKKGQETLVSAKHYNNNHDVSNLNMTSKNLSKSHTADNGTDNINAQDTLTNDSIDNNNNNDQQACNIFVKHDNNNHDVSAFHMNTYNKVQHTTTDGTDNKNDEDTVRIAPSISKKKLAANIDNIDNNNDDIKDDKKDNSIEQIRYLPTKTVSHTTAWSHSIPLSRIQLNLLVFGFSRLYHGDNVPSDISNICQCFYNDILYCSYNIDGYNEDTIVDIRGYSFYLQIVTKRHLDLYIKPKHEMSFSSYLLYYEIYCDELGMLKKDSRTINESEGIRLVRLREKQYASIKVLSFRIYIDIISLDCNDYNISYDRIELDSDIHHEWEIDEKLLGIFNNANKGEVFYSNNFGSNRDSNLGKQYGFTLRFVPFVSHQSPFSKDRVAILSLECLCIPNSVKTINFDVTLEMVNICGRISICKQNVRWKSDRLVHRIYISPILFEDMCKLSWCTFTVRIYINSVQSLSGEDITKSNWNLYGIDLWKSLLSGYT